MILGSHLIDFKSKKVQVLGQWIKLDDHLFRILERLVLSAGTTVTKQKLAEIAWPSQQLTNNSEVHKAINKLRKILLDEASSPIYIETIDRTGYRMIANIRGLRDQC